MNSLSTFRKSARRITKVFFKRQAMALCYRETSECLELLLVSKKSSRHVLTFPKGTVEPGENAWDAAGREAYEEAGASGSVHPGRIGTFYYRKRNRFPLIRVDVYPMRVDEIADIFPEAKVRERQWLAVAEARGMVSAKIWSMIEAALSGDGGDC